MSPFSICFSPGMIRAVLSARLLARASPRRYEPDLHRCHLRRRHLLARFLNRDPRQEQLFPWPAWYLPIKLLYTCNMLIMLQSALTSNVFIVCQTLATRFPSNLFVKILDAWEVCNPTRLLYYTFSNVISSQVWHRLLHVATTHFQGSCSGPHTYCRLDYLHALCLRSILEDLDWVVEVGTGWLDAEIS